MKHLLITFLLAVGICSFLLCESIWDNPVVLANYNSNIEFTGTGTQTSEDCEILYWIEGSAPAQFGYVQKYNAQMQPQWATPVIIQDKLSETSIIEASDGSILLLGFKEASTHRLYAYKIDANGNFVWNSSGVIAVNMVGYSSYSFLPKLAPDNDGGLYLIWETRDAYDVTLQHLNSDGSVSLGANGMTLNSFHEGFVSPDILVSSDNNVIISYSTDSITVVKKLTPSANTIWTQTIAQPLPCYQYVDARLLPADNNSYYVISRSSFRIGIMKLSNAGIPLWDESVYVINSNNVVFSIWQGEQVSNQDYSISIMWMNNYDIYAQKVNPNGQLMWGQNGVLLASLPCEVSSIKCITDSQSGVYAVYSYDAQSRLGQRICMQHVSTSGIALTQPVVIRFYEHPYARTNAFLLTRHNTNLLVNWMDYRNDITGIYAQCLTQQGVKLFDENDIAVETGSIGYVSKPVLSSRLNDVFVAWLYSQGTDSKIYYQIVNPNSTLQFEAEGVPLNSDVYHDILKLQTVATNDNYTLITWLEHDNNYQIKAQLLDPLCNQLWETNGRVIFQSGLPCQDFFTQYYNGAYYIIWTATNAANHLRIFGQKFINQTAQWAIPGIQLVADNPENPAIDYYLMSLTGDYLTWNCYTPLSGSIYTLKIDDAGQPSPGFDAFGNLVATRPADCDYQQVVTSKLLQDDNVILLKNTYVFDEGAYEWSENIAYRISDTGTQVWSGGISLPYDNLIVSGSSMLSVYQYSNALFVKYYNTDGEFVYMISSPSSIPDTDRLNITLLDNQRLLFTAKSDFNNQTNLLHWYYIPDEESSHIPSDYVVTQLINSSPFLVSKFGEQAWVLWMNDYLYATSMYIQLLNNGSVGIDENSVELPTIFSLHSNFPNPFKLKTTISFDLKTDSNCQLNIYNTKGQLVKTVHKGLMSKGYHTFDWDGRNEKDIRLSTGVYFYSLSDGGHRTITKKLILFQ